MIMGGKFLMEKNSCAGGGARSPPGSAPARSLGWRPGAHPLARPPGDQPPARSPSGPAAAALAWPASERAAAAAAALVAAQQRACCSPAAAVCQPSSPLVAAQQQRLNQLVTKALLSCKKPGPARGVRILSGPASWAAGAGAQPAPVRPLRGQETHREQEEHHTR